MTIQEDAGKILLFIYDSYVNLGLNPSLKFNLGASEK